MTEEEVIKYLAERNSNSQKQPDTGGSSGKHYKEYPVVFGKEIRRTRSCTREKLVYVDETLALEQELENLTQPSLAGAERSAGKNGGLFLYSYIAPPRNSARQAYASLIKLVGFMLLPIRLPLMFLSWLWRLLKVPFRFVYESIIEALGVLIPLAIKLIVAVVLFGLVAAFIKDW